MWQLFGDLMADPRHVVNIQALMATTIVDCELHSPVEVEPTAGSFVGEFQVR